MNCTRTDIQALDLKRQQIRNRRHTIAAQRMQNTKQFDTALRSGMRALWLRGHLCDAIVMARGGIAFTAHSSVLSASSRILAQCLSKASAGSSSHLLSLVSYSQEDVALVLDFIYGNTPKCAKDWSRLGRLANSLGLVGWNDKGILDICATYCNCVFINTPKFNYKQYCTL